MVGGRGPGRRGGGPGGGGSGPARHPRRRGSGAPPVCPAARSGCGRRAPRSAGRRRPARAGSRPAGRAPGGARSIRRPRSRARRSAPAARGRRGASPPAGRAPARRRSRSATLAGVVPAVGRGGRSMTRTSTERPARSIPAIERPSSRVSGVRTTSQSSRTPRAAASTGSSARARSSQATIAPSAWASAASRRARVVAPELGGAAERDAGAPREAARARRSRRGPGSRSGRSARRQFAARPAQPGRARARMGRRAARPEAAPWPALRPPAELRRPIASGGTPEQPTRPGRGWPSDAQTRTSVLVGQWASRPMHAPDPTACRSSGMGRRPYSKKAYPTAQGPRNVNSCLHGINGTRRPGLAVPPCLLGMKRPQVGRSDAE